MANEQQYYNPIIQAMIASVQAQQNAQRQGTEAQNMQAQRQAQEEQIANQKEEITNRHEIEKGTLENATKLLGAHLAQSHLEQMGAFQKMIGEGANPQQLQPQAPDIPMDAFAGPQQLAQQKASEAGGVVTAQESARQPFEMAAADRQLRNQLVTLGATGQNQKDLEGLRATEESQLEKMRSANAQSVANINGRYHLMGMGMLAQNGQEGQGTQAKQLVDGLYDGSTDYSKLTADEKRLVQQYTSGTGELNSLPLNQKDYTTKLNAIGGLQSLMDQFRDMAQNYSVDSPGSLEKGNIRAKTPIGTYGVTLPGSDLASKEAALKSQGGTLGTFFDQQNRKSDAEIMRQISGEFDPTATIKQNMDKVNSHMPRLQQTVKSTFVGMSPDRVNKVLGDRGITDFGAFGGTATAAPQAQGGGIKSYKQYMQNPQTGHVVGSNDGKTWFDAQTGTAIPTGGGK